MRIFLDTNVLLDVYLKRAGEPGSAKVIGACGQPWNLGFVAVHTLSNAFYLIERQRTRGNSSAMSSRGPGSRRSRPRMPRGRRG